MLFPESYLAALCLTILTMICWGSWANTLKLCPGFRFQLFYWDYVIGMAVGAIFWGLTAGSMGHAGTPFLADLKHTATGPMLYAMAGGAIFNVANLLLVAAIDVAGMAVAFPVGIGLALVIGAISNYVIKPVGNPLLLFGGVALVVVAIVLDAAAYQQARSHGQNNDSPRDRHQPGLRRADGLLLSVCCARVEWRGGHGRSWSLRGDGVFHDRRNHLGPPRKLAADEETAGRERACGRRWLLARAAPLASGWSAGRSHLVHWRRGELPRIRRASGGAGGVL